MKNKKKKVYRTIDGVGVAYLIFGFVGFGGCIILPIILIFPIHHDFWSFLPSIILTIILLVFIRINPAIHCILRRIIIDYRKKTISTNADITLSKKKLQARPILIKIDDIISLTIYFSYSNTDGVRLNSMFKVTGGHVYRKFKSNKGEKFVEERWYAIPDWLHIAAFKMRDGSVCKIVLDDMSDKKVHQLIRDIKMIKCDIVITKDNSKIYDN